MSTPQQQIETFRTPTLPPSLPFPAAVRAGDTVYVSGQIGIVPGELRLVDGGLEAEARQALDHLRDALEAAGSALDRVVKCTVYFADIGDFARFNEIYRDYFRTHQPARSGVAVKALALGARIEIDCIALTR